MYGSDLCTTLKELHWQKYIEGDPLTFACSALRFCIPSFMWISKICFWPRVTRRERLLLADSGQFLTAY
jgi:hypothetical protein